MGCSTAWCSSGEVIAVLQSQRANAAESGVVIGLRPAGREYDFGRRGIDEVGNGFAGIFDGGAHLPAVAVDATGVAEVVL